MQRINPASWQKFSKQIQMGKDTVQQLSKLYIIIHEKVKSSFKKSIINSEYDFSKEAEHHIQFIKTILIRIRQAKDDQYLIQVQQKMLEKYQRSLLILLEQIDLNLKVEQNKLNIDFQNLKRLKPVPHQEYDLQDQIIKSTRRMVRSKSGKKTIKIANEIQTQLVKNKLLRSPEETHNLANQVKNKIHQNVKQHVQASSTNLSFKKKYQNDNLQKYLNLRKQFADLIILSETFQKNQSNLQNQQSQSQIMIKNKTFINKNKLFPQFQIKTKFIKPKVKQNIMQAIAEIKIKLLEQYCKDNIDKIKQANEGGLIKLQNKQNSKLRKSYSTSKMETKAYSKVVNQYNLKKQKLQSSGTNYTDYKAVKGRQSQVNDLMSKTQTKLKSTSIFGKSYNSQKWDDNFQKTLQKKLQNKLVLNKISNTLR